MADKKNTLTIENFESQLSKSILERGRDYFENGAIVDLISESKGNWTALVSGNEDYKVRIKFSGKSISDCSCDCPHDVQYCKHIVATLYAISEHGPDIAEDDPHYKKSAGKRDISEVVNNLSEKELKEFVIEYGKNNSEFCDLLHALYSPLSKAEGKAVYARLIKNAADRAGGRGRYIDYYNAANFIRDIDKLLTQAESALRIKHYAVASDIAFAVIENVHEILKDTDDSGGGIGSCITKAFEILMHLLTLDILVALRQNIFRDAIKEAKSAQYDYFDFDDSWLEVVIVATHDLESENRALDLIDTLLEACKGKKDEWFREFEMQRLIKHKLTLLRKMGREKEADKARLKFLHLSQIRMELITEKVAGKKYSEAKQLIKEGIGIAKTKDQPGTVNEYKKILLQIAEQENDIAGLRNIARDLYEKGRNLEYYKIIKDTYKKKEWPEMVEEFIKEIQMQNKSVAGIRFNDDSRLADIFVEEQYWERLLQIIQGSTALHFIDQYSSWLTAKYPGETVQVYRKALIEYAVQNTGRNHYITIRDRLKKMQTWNGGREVVEELVVEFTQQYKARKAMLEELAKINL